MPRIEVVLPEQAGGELKTVYDEILALRGKIAAVHTIQSLNPESIRAHMELYRVVMFARSALTRAEREMMAVVVSAVNGCDYCVAHHGEALDHFWRDRGRVEDLRRRLCACTGLSVREAALCWYAELTTRTPGAEAVTTAQDALRAAGVSDQGILDATLVGAYFSFVNRIVLALGVELEEDAGGFKYE